MCSYLKFTFFSVQRLEYDADTDFTPGIWSAMLKTYWGSDFSVKHYVKMCLNTAVISEDGLQDEYKMGYLALHNVWASQKHSVQTVSLSCCYSSSLQYKLSVMSSPVVQCINKNFVVKQLQPHLSISKANQLAFPFVQPLKSDAVRDFTPGILTDYLDLMFILRRRSSTE
ncbi:hypothetical protein J6590_049500 [Homalodisca vitripennis]|nr:hypothetical protein J6590_049500 [Homalodisca vitripennis]